MQTPHHRPARPSRPWSARPAPTPPQRYCPTWPASSSPCTPSKPTSPPWCKPPSLPGPDLHARDRGPGRRRLPSRDPGQDLQAPAPSQPPTPGPLPSHTAQAHRSAMNTSVTPSTSASNTPCSPQPSPPRAPTPSPERTASANATKANATTRPSSPWPTTASRPRTPRSATTPSTIHNDPQPLNTPHRSTPTRQGVEVTTGR